MKTIILFLVSFFFAIGASIAQPNAYVLKPHEGVDLHEGFGDEFKATPNTTGGKYLFTVTIKPSGFRTPIHKQSRDLSFYVLEGELSVYFNSKTHVLTPGHFAFIPKDTPLAFSSSGANGAKWIHLFSPGEGMIAFWQKQGEIGAKNLDAEEKNRSIIEEASNFGVEYVAPSPFGSNGN